MDGLVLCTKFCLSRNKLLLPTKEEGNDIDGATSLSCVNTSLEMCQYGRGTRQLDSQTDRQHKQESVLFVCCYQLVLLLLCWCWC